MAALLRQVRQVENEDATGIVACDVLVDVGAEGILDLDARDIEFGKAVAHDDTVALADIDAGIRRTAHGDIVDQHVLRRHRIDAIGTVLLARPVGPLDPEIGEGDLVGTL